MVLSLVGIVSISLSESGRAGRRGLEGPGAAVCSEADSESEFQRLWVFIAASREEAVGEDRGCGATM